MDKEQSRSRIQSMSNFFNGRVCLSGWRVQWRKMRHSLVALQLRKIIVNYCWRKIWLTKKDYFIPLSKFLLTMIHLFKSKHIFINILNKKYLLISCWHLFINRIVCLQRMKYLIKDIQLIECTTWYKIIFEQQLCVFISKFNLMIVSLSGFSISF